MKRLLISVLVLVMALTVLPAGSASFAAPAKAADTAAQGDASASGQDDASVSGQDDARESRGGVQIESGQNAGGQSSGVQIGSGQDADGQNGGVQIGSEQNGPVIADDDEDDDQGIRQIVISKQKKHIKVAGVVLERNAYCKTRITDVIRVSGAYGRKVELQQMKKRGKWKTVRSFTVRGRTNAKVTIKYPARTKTYTYWRLHIDGDSRTKEYNSGTITVVSRNIKGLSLNARSACIYCMDTGEVIYGKNMNKKLPMASTTKIMTAVVVMENMSMKKKARISRRAARTPYRNLYMKRGDRYYVKDLFKAMMISSSNDAARALAENTAGSSGRFVKKMNRKARKLGLTKTHYTDEVGFGSSTHRSSAKDLARLMTYAYQSKTFRKSINKKTYSFRNVRRSRWHKVWSSSYPMYRFSKNYLGGKTGTTSAARCCFVAVYRYGGRTYVCVNLGSRNNFFRWRDSKRMYRYIRNYGRYGTMRGGETEEPDSDLYYEVVDLDDLDLGDPDDTPVVTDDENGAANGEDGSQGGSSNGDDGSQGGGSGSSNDSGSGGFVIPDSDGGNGEVLSIAG